MNQSDSIEQITIIGQRKIKYFMEKIYNITYEIENDLPPIDTDNVEELPYCNQIFSLICRNMMGEIVSYPECYIVAHLRGIDLYYKDAIYRSIKEEHGKYYLHHYFENKPSIELVERSWLIDASQFQLYITEPDAAYFAWSLDYPMRRMLI